jgi:type IV pilus assembly protein PilA
MSKGIFSGEKGFTLIELMIVIGIIGILAAIAIPQYSSYRSRSYDAAAVEDLRNAETAQEIYFVNNLTYCANTSTLIGTTYMLLMSKGVRLAINAASTDANGYTMTARHPSGSNTYRIQGPGGTIAKD